MTGVQAILDALPSTIVNLCLDANWSDCRDEKDDALVQSVVRWLNRVPAVRLSLRGGQRAHLRRTIVPLFDALKTNTTLERLDISYNWIGDYSAWRLAEALRENKKLKRISLDRNQITLVRDVM